MRTLDELLREAEERIERLSPAGALEATRAGALLVDIRSELSREREGVIPGAIHIPRSVLEWRFEPGGAWRNPHVGGLDQQVVVVCDHGYSSALAAAMLVRLGYERVGDVLGGFVAWCEAGLPTRPAGERHEGLAGMNGPD